MCFMQETSGTWGIHKDLQKAIASCCRQNIFCSITGGWIQNSKSKNFVSWTEWNCYFLMACFSKNYYFKKHVSQNTKVHMFEVPVFVISLTEPLSFFASEYD